MNVKEFIQHVFLNEYKRLIHDYGFHYISFSLIALGIELLGACIDEHDFGERGRSSQRFRRAIRELFPPEYKHFNKKNDPYDLCDNLRNGFAHQFRPGSTVSLTHRDESIREGTKHLQIHTDGKLILISENLYKDFESACKEVIRRIDNRLIGHQKVYSDFLLVPQPVNSLASKHIDVSSKIGFTSGSVSAEGYPYEKMMPWDTTEYL